MDGTTTKCFEGSAPNLARDFSSEVAFLVNVDFPAFFHMILSNPYQIEIGPEGGSSRREKRGGILIGEHNIAIHDHLDRY